MGFIKCRFSEDIFLRLVPGLFFNLSDGILQHRRICYNKFLRGGYLEVVGCASTQSGPLCRCGYFDIVMALSVFSKKFGVNYQHHGTYSYHRVFQRFWNFL